MVMVSDILDQGSHYYQKSKPNSGPSETHANNDDGKSGDLLKADYYRSMWLQVSETAV